jgi:hypothetical protein
VRKRVNERALVLTLDFVKCYLIQGGQVRDTDRDALDAGLMVPKYFD